MTQLASGVQSSENPFKQVLIQEDGQLALWTAMGGIEVPLCEAFKTWPLTIELWGKFRGRDESLVSVGRGDAYRWRLFAGMQGDFATGVRGFDPAIVWTSQWMFDEKWHHLAFTFDGTSGHLYVDGVHLFEYTPKPLKDAAFEDGPLIIGTDVDAPWHESDGWIRQVRLSNVVRKFDGAKPGSLETDAHTLGLWHVADTDAQGVVRDRSLHGRHGTLRPVPLISMDEVDRQSFAAASTPLDVPAVKVALSPGSATHPVGPPALSLDGAWQLGQGYGDGDRLNNHIHDWLPAQVPGSVHAALVKAERIPDPTFARHDRIAREMSFQTWWYRRTFSRPAGVKHQLEFDGIAVHATVWFNGTKLGEHEGMFGGPKYDIDALVKDENDLLIRIDPAPLGPSFFAQGDNSGWRKTVVFNNVYGWHYSNIPALGVWGSVRVTSAPTVKLQHPFVITRDALAGAISLRVDLASQQSASGRILGTIEPENFTGAPHRFEHRVGSIQGVQAIRLDMTISDARAWWPNGAGDPNLYRLKLSFIPDAGDGVADHVETTFGVRTIQMAPSTYAPKKTLYNWKFVINGQPMFIKGTGWCTLDPLMDFRRERYDRFLTIARQQNCQMVRAWGAGMPETDEFYDLCDRYGLLVMQEWPTAWNSHEVQPYDVLEETVRLNTLRLRNHPSLAMWGGGNESSHPFGKAIDMMGRLAIELDDTRPFHRGEPWGGSDHNYSCWWGRAHLDTNLKMTSRFFGEFGIASMPVHESVLRYLPDEEKNTWPPAPESSLAHHTPVFNQREDVSRLQQYAGYFSACATLERATVASQIAQVVALRHPLERARTRWPDCTGALYYKLNDNYPAASWAVTDWYGAIKLAHWFCKSAFAPVHACVVLDALNLRGKDAKLPVVLLDDFQALAGCSWRVTVRAIDGKLAPVHTQTFEGSGAIDRGRKLGDFTLSASQTESAPLLVVADVYVKDSLVDRGWYFHNAELTPDSLFTLPRTTLAAQLSGNKVTVTNTGSLPAVGVMVQRPGHLDSFLPSDNCLWLDAGQSRVIEVNDRGGLMVEAWNAERTTVTSV